MKHKHTTLFLLLLGCLPFLCGCVSQLSNPLEKAQATPVPGLNMQLHAASASSTNVDHFQATLYYRFLDQPMLAAEARTLTIPRDESTEFAIVTALLAGPSAGNSDLQRIFPASVAVESVIPRNNVLFVTFNEALLTDDGIPSDWELQPAWATEAPLRRRLAIQSIVASITESFPYTGVQILVRRTSEQQTSLRLDSAYFLDGSTGLSDPQTRDESVLLTPQNTALSLLAAWQSGDTETLYAFLTHSGPDSLKPSYQAALSDLDALPPLSAFFLQGGGNTSADGQTAVLTVDLTVLHQGESILCPAYPLAIIRENDVWKLRYSELQNLMAL